MPKDDNLAVIQPRKGKFEKDLPASGVLIFAPQDLDLFFRCFPKVPERSHKIFLTEVYTGQYHGTPVFLAGPMLGAPQAVLVLEKLVVLGVRRVVAVGWCGSLRSDLRVGEVLLPIAAVSEEGTSKHYPISTSFPGPSHELLGALRESLRPHFPKIQEGKVWTTDAPYRETVGKILKYQKEDILAVDMESSALFTVAHFRKIQFITILIVSDELFTLEWVHGFKERRFLETREKLAELIMAFLGQP